MAEPLQQLYAQLASALPYDLRETDLSEYKGLDAKWQRWEDVRQTCANAAADLFEAVCGSRPRRRAAAPPDADPEGTAVAPTPD